MDLWQLHIFCSVVDTKSFSKAASTVHLSQPTISSHIKDLEEYFDIRLLDRMAKEVVPTQAGKLLYAYAKKLLALRDKTESAMAEFQGKMTGRLILGGSTIPGGYVLPKLIGQFVKVYPDVKISLEIGDTEQIETDVLSGKLEIGVIGAPTDRKQLLQEKLMKDEMRLIVLPTHPLASKKEIVPKDLETVSFIARESGSGTLASFQTKLEEHKIAIERVPIVAEMGSTEAVIQGIKNEVGVSILSTIAVEQDIVAGKLIALPIKGIDLTRHFYLIRHRLRSLSPLSSAFSEFLQKTLR